MNYSFWEKYFIETPTDVTIIGSGIVGLSTAISLKELHPGLSMKILERGAAPYGASTKNAGFSCFGSVSELLDDIDTMGETACMEVVKMRWKGLQKLRDRVGDLTMEYLPAGGTELFRRQDQVLKESCLSKLNYCNELISDHLSLVNCYKNVENTQFHNFDAKSIFNQYEGCINPMKMMNTLIKKAISLGVFIINGIHIKDINKKEKQLSSDNNLLIAYDKLIVCTNGFTTRLLPSLQVVPARNQVLITRPIPNLFLPSTYHIDKGYLYFRQYENRILLGGGRNQDALNESTDQFGNTQQIQEYLSSTLETIYPGASSLIEHWWSGILGIGDTKFPICEWVDKDILVGVRLGGMGVAIGSNLGERLADMLLQNN